MGEFFHNDLIREELEIRAWWSGLPADHPLKQKEYVDLTDIPLDSPLAKRAARIYNEAFECDMRAKETDG